MDPAKVFADMAKHRLTEPDMYKPRLTEPKKKKVVLDEIEITADAPNSPVSAYGNLKQDFYNKGVQSIRATAPKAPALDFGGKTREEMEALMMTNPRAVYSAIDQGILDESVGYALQGAVERPARQRTQRTQVKPRKATPFPLVSALKNTQDPVEQLRFQYEQKGSQPLKIGRGGLSQTAMEKMMAETPAAVFEAIDQGILDESVGYALQGTRRKN